MRAVLPAAARAEEKMVVPRAGGFLSRSLEALSDEEFWDYARELARMVPAAAHPEEYLECSLSLGQGCCFVSLKALCEVVPPPHRFAVLPASPAWLLGLVAWRGEVIAAIDLPGFLCGSPTASAGEGMLLVADHPDQPIGLLVPAIGSILSLEYTSLEECEALPVRRELLRGLRGTDPVLDVPALLAEAVREIERAVTYG
jgi:chemotaxis signal transduction protein